MSLNNFTSSTAYEVDYGTTVQDVVADGATGPNYEVWFKYVAKVGETVVGIRAFATIGSAYDPLITVWVGTPPTLSIYLNFSGIAARKPIQVPLTAGTTYYFRVRDATTGTVPDVPLQFVVTQAPNAGTVIGSLVVNDDTDGYPAAIISPTDGTIIGFKEFPAGEGGEVLPDGDILVHDVGAGLISLYDKTLTLKWSIAQVLNGHPPMTSDRVDTFYVANGSGGPGQTFYKISRASQSIVATFVPTNDGFPVGIAVTLDNTVIYYTTGSPVNAPIRRWDIVNGVELSTFVAAPPVTGSWGQDLIRYPDGTLIAPLSVSLGADIVYAYDSGGAVINSITLGATETFNHLARGADDTTFWIWSYDSDATHRFRQIRVSDFSVLANFTTSEFNQGISARTVAASMDLFGDSNSCPFFILTSGGAGGGAPLVDLSVPCCANTTTPGTGSTAGATLPTDETKPIPEWIAACTGGGVGPNGTTDTNSEDWTT